MPGLISGRTLVNPTGTLSPTRYQFLNLANAQPALGPSPTTGTGYTLISYATGTVFSSSLGNLNFNYGVISPNTPSLSTITLQVSTITGNISLVTQLVSITGNLTFTNTVSSFINLGGRESVRIPNYYEGVTPPTNTTFWAGDHWYEPTNQVLYEYVLDDIGERWVDITGPFFSTDVAQFGYVGSIGGIGYSGSRGDKGDAGGYTGSQGLLGYYGSQGISGYLGSIGYIGSAGVGYIGSKGYTGSSGLGYTGSRIRRQCRLGIYRFTRITRVHRFTRIRRQCRFGIYRVSGPFRLCR